MKAWLFKTREEAEACIAGIMDACPMERVREVRGGRVVREYMRPAKIYDRPRQLADGSWAVRYHRSIEGRRALASVAKRSAIPRERDAATLRVTSDPITGRVSLRK